jgi:hypothetical protein
MKMGTTRSPRRYEAARWPTPHFAGIARTRRGIPSVEMLGPKRGHRVESPRSRVEPVPSPDCDPQAAIRALRAARLDRLFKRSDTAAERASVPGAWLFRFARAAALDQRKCAFAGDRSPGLSVSET